MNFDQVIDRRGSHSMKWDMMEPIFDVSPRDGLAMWVADMDFRSPEPAHRAVQEMIKTGIYGYYGDDRSYRDAICYWMQTRHGWEIEPGWIFSTHGLVNGTALCIDSFTEPGDGIVLFTPVYHAFARIIRMADREVVECPLVLGDNRYGMDFESYDAQMTGNEKMVILCSPQNPGGQVWDPASLQALARFCERHDLILLSDEIHHDLVYPGYKHTPMPLAAPEIEDRLVMMTATTKTFNIAGVHCGNVIIADERLRAIFAKRCGALGISPNSFGPILAEALYTPEGARWVDSLMVYLEGNRQVFDRGMNALCGVRSMPLEATYLSWVDFTDTELAPEEVTRRVEKDARIAVNHGKTFGKGGENFLRFNIAAPQQMIEIAVERLHSAFRDLI